MEFCEGRKAWTRLHHFAKGAGVIVEEREGDLTVGGIEERVWWWWWRHGFVCVCVPVCGVKGWERGGVSLLLSVTILVGCLW